MKTITDDDLKKRLENLDYKCEEPEHGDETESMLNRVKEGIDKEHLANWIYIVLTRLLGILINTALRVGDVLGSTATVSFKECESVTKRAVKIKEMMPPNMFKTQAEFNRNCYRVGIEVVLMLVGGSFPVKFESLRKVIKSHNIICMVLDDEEERRLEKARDDILKKCKNNDKNCKQIDKARSILLSIKEPKTDWNVIEEIPIVLDSYDDVKKVG